MNDILSFILFLFAASVTQNIVLTTGFGSSMLLRVVRHPKDIGMFTLMLTQLSVLTVAISYPLDKLIGIGFWAKLLRPLMVLAVATVLYFLYTWILSRFFPRLYARIAKFMPLASFNNLVIGVPLICNHNFPTTYLGAIGLAIGCSIGFAVLSWLTAEGVERMDNPDIPTAFRGLPILLIYVGLVALAIMGFSSTFTLI